MDMSELLNTLEKVSTGRVLACAAQEQEGELNTAKIPVRAQNTGDKTDRMLRRYCADWLRTHLKDMSVETRFERTPGVSWWTEAREEIPLWGMITLNWWPKPPLTEYEQLLALQRQRKKDARKEESEE